MVKRTLFVPLLALVLCGCAGSQSKTMIGGNLFAQWRPTKQQQAEDSSLEPIRWTHAESMQLGSYVSMVLMQVGENPPELVEGSMTTQAGPINAALGAGGLIGAAVLFNPDPDQTNVEQEGGGATQKQGQFQGQQQNQRQYQKQKSKVVVEGPGNHHGGHHGGPG